MVRTLFVGLFALVGAVAFAQVESLLERADQAYENEQFRQAERLLEQALERASSGSDRAEVYWRLSRVRLSQGDRLNDRDAPDEEILARYEEGERYGQQAIDADSSNHLGYYWKASNIGKWGQTRGVLNSLFRAGEMRDLLVEAVNREPEHPDSYYVLGQLYAKVPGLISFGNTEFAVSLARKSIALHEEEMASGEEEEREHDYYIQLASHLMDRGWSERRRNREHDRLRREHREADGIMERSFRFEGTVDIPNLSDWEEARRLLTDTISRMERIDDPSASDERQLERAREHLAEH